MCRHHTPCLPAAVPDRDEARVIVPGLRQGWDTPNDGGGPWANGQSIPTHKAAGCAA
jgi:hypothetical protein